MAETSRRIRVRGAREHNLKNIDVDIPREKLVVITGLSGSGKSSLAFDTIYAEGQRRYVESLSAYARQFLGQLEKPDVDSIEGLSPAISIEQKTTHRNPRSTVGTVTEIYDYLRLVYARVGVPHCPECGRKLEAQPVDTIIERILTLPERLNAEKVKVQVLAPLARSQKGRFEDLMESYLKKGFLRIRIDGETHLLESPPALDKNRKHNIDLVVDRLVLESSESDAQRGRLADSVELALQEGKGMLNLLYEQEGQTKVEVYSSHLACPDCHISFPPINHRLFSFNSPDGACPACSGLGMTLDFHPEKVISKPENSLAEGIIGGLGWSAGGSWYKAYMTALSETLGFSMDTPWNKLPAKVKKVILYGDKNLKLKIRYSDGEDTLAFTRTFEGIIPNLKRRYEETTSDKMRAYMERYMVQSVCTSCGGARLKKEALAVTLQGKNIYEYTQMNLASALKFHANLKLSKTDQIIAEGALKEIVSRLRFLNDVGVGYLSLDRTAGTLSGGEAQRIRLATQIGSALMGVLYVLDEPSIGLHQSDNSRLIQTLQNLKNLGNTILVVEHDEETMEAADYIIDMGPGAGVHGGEVTFAGTFAQIQKSRKSLTGMYLSGKEKIPIPESRRAGNGKSLTVKGASENNLKNVTVEIPLGKIICVTGLSGSGKSTLVNEIIYKGLLHEKGRGGELPGKYKKMDGLNEIDKVIDINQAPIGRTPRSNPATYTGTFTPIRDLFAQLPASKMRGFKPGRFSFNVPGGRCEACQGDGVRKIEMHFLADVYVTCEVCGGKRYNRETLDVRFNNKNIHDVLEMTVEEALEFFQNIPVVRKKLQALYDVGLTYIKLGQPATTLSGGEAQRVKLATELSKTATGNTLYILDEPTTGLHFHDIRQLLNVLNTLADQGNTILVIEHNMDVIKTADWIIDLGPGGGDEGGEVVATGTPESVAQDKSSLTGKYLKKWLK